MALSHTAFTTALTERVGYRGNGRVALRNGTDGFTFPSVGDNRAAYDVDLLDYLFWGAQVRGLSPSTLRVRMDFVHRLYVFAGVALRDIEPHHLLAFEKVAIAGRAAESRRAYVSHLRSFFRWCVKTGICSVDPTEVLTMPSIPRHLPRPIEESDLAEALAAARPKMRCMLALASYAGLRCCEIAGLDHSDLRIEADGAAILHVRKAKGSRERSVEVGQVVIDALRAHGLKRRGALFIGQDGRQISPGSVSKSINRYLAEHNIPSTAHQLRHRFGSVTYQLSRDLRLVQELLGHSSPNTTAIYARPSTQAARIVMKQLDALARPTPGPIPAGA